MRSRPLTWGLDALSAMHGRLLIPSRNPSCIRLVQQAARKLRGEVQGCTDFWAAPACWAIVALTAVADPPLLIPMVAAAAAAAAASAAAPS